MKFPLAIFKGFQARALSLQDDLIPQFFYSPDA